MRASVPNLSLHQRQALMYGRMPSRHQTLGVLVSLGLLSPANRSNYRICAHDVTEEGLAVIQAMVGGEDHRLRSLYPDLPGISDLDELFELLAEPDTELRLRKGREPVVLQGGHPVAIASGFLIWRITAAGHGKDRLLRKAAKGAEYSLMLRGGHDPAVAPEQDVGPSIPRSADTVSDIASASGLRTFEDRCESAGRTGE